MKYTNELANLANQVLTYKGMTLALGVLCSVLVMATVILSIRDPIVVERGCSTELRSSADPGQTDVEIKAFVKSALEQRFNTGTTANDSYLPIEQVRAKKEMLIEFAKKNIVQSVIVRGIDLTKQPFYVDADRVFAVGDVRAAYKFPLSIWIESKARSADNPYGLILSNVEALKVKEEKSE